MKKPFQTANVLLIAVAHMMHDIFGSFLAPVLPLLRETTGITLTQAGWLTVAQRFPSLFNPVIGWSLQGKTMKKIVVAMPAVTALAMSLIGLADSFWNLAFLLTIAGISSAFFHVPAPVMMKTVAGHRLGMGMSFFMLGGEVARFLGPLVVLAAVDLWGLGGMWRLLFLGLIASGLLFWRFRTLDIEEPSDGKVKQGARAELRAVMPSMSAITLIMLSRAFLRSGISAFLTVYLVDQGHSLWYAGAALATYQAAGAAGTLLAGTLSDKLGRRIVLLASAITTPIFMFFFIYSGVGLHFVALAMLGLSAFAVTPVLLAMIQELGSDRPAFVNGLFMTFNFITGSIAAVTIGKLGDMIGLESTYKIAAWISIAAIAFVLLLPSKK